MDEVLTVISLIVALVAVVLSSVLSWRAVSLARDANHFPVVADLLAVICGVTDADLLVHQVRHGAIRTWTAAEPLIEAERQIRGGEFSFMNSFERFVEIAKKVDVQESDVVDGRWRTPDS